MTHEAQQPIEDSTVQLPGDQSGPTGPSGSSILRLFETIPDEEISLYQDLINSGRAIRGPFNTEPPRKRITSRIYDDTTPWFETGDAAFMIGLLSRSARRGLMAVQNQFGPQTPNSNDEVDRFFHEQGAVIPDSLRKRKVKGSYDGLTKEAMIRLMAHDLTMDLYQEKKDKGSKWAAGFATAAELVIIDGITLGAGHAAGPVIGGLLATGRNVARAGRGVRSGLQLSRTRSIAKTPAGKTGQTIQEGRRRGLTKALAKKRVKSPTTPDASIPTEAAAAIGTHASRTGSSVADSTNLLARAWGSNVVKGATLTGGGVFIQEGGIKLLDDVRTWPEIALDTAIAAAAGGVVSFAVPFSTRFIRSFGDDAARVAEKAAKTKGGVGKLIELDDAGIPIATLGTPLRAPSSIADVRKFIQGIARSPVQFLGMKVERIIGRTLIRGNVSEEWAQFFGSIARPLVWGGPIYGVAAAFGLAPSVFGTEGMADKMKMLIAKEVGKKIKNEDDTEGQVSLQLQT